MLRPESLGWLGTGTSGIGIAASLGAATLVREDLPTITAAVLAAAGRLSCITAFLGCFLGIWLGDALLYFAARGLGRPLLQLPEFRRLAYVEAITRSELWFAQRGPWLLASSRFLPGTRLPTCLAAGSPRVPRPQFPAAIRRRSRPLEAVGILAGGLAGQSKIETLRQLHQTNPGFTAEVWLLEPHPRPSAVMRSRPCRRR